MWPKKAPRPRLLGTGTERSQSSVPPGNPRTPSGGDGQTNRPRGARFWSPANDALFFGLHALVKGGVDNDRNGQRPEVALDQGFDFFPVQSAHTGREARQRETRDFFGLDPPL